MVCGLAAMQAESILAKLEKIVAEEQDDSIREEAEKSISLRKTKSLNFENSLLSGP